MASSFIDADPETIYLDGNSLGRVPAATPGLIGDVIERQWGARLIEAWEQWIDLPSRIGDELARDLLGAPPGSVIVSDSTTVNFYKLACAALDARPGRDGIVTDRDNFPTDRYVLEGLAASRGARIRWVEGDAMDGPSARDIADALDARTALVALSHVAYRSAAVADMHAINRSAHDAGALTLWDLSHSVGALPIQLSASDTDLAVGCTYKYLNGGPGSPAFLYVRPELQGELRQPIWGWFGQQDQFAMGPAYRPRHGIERFTVGTPAILSLAAVAAGIRSITDIGIDSIRATSIELTGQLISETEAHLVGRGFGIGSPRAAERRGGHVLLTHPDARRISGALRRFAKVIGDYRSPDGLRLSPAPAYISRSQVSEAVSRIATLVDSGRHRSIEPDASRVT